MIAIMMKGNRGEGVHDSILRFIDAILKTEPQSTILVRDHFGELGPDLEPMNPITVYLSRIVDVDKEMIINSLNSLGPERRVVHLLGAEHYIGEGIDYKKLVESIIEINCNKKVYLVEKENY